MPVMPPGPNEKHNLAGAPALVTGAFVVMPANRLRGIPGFMWSSTTIPSIPPRPLKSG
jgi:hypothetical protein